MTKRIHRQEGFTLIELMIVILIIGILVGIAVPVFLAARSNAQAKSCQANQRNFETSSEVFASETGSYPAAATYAAGAYNGGTGTNTQIWPDGYFQGKLVAATHMPLCPAAGTVTNTVAWGATQRPLLTCSIVSNRR